MILAGMGAGGKSVQTPDPMRHTILDKEVQGAVRNRGLGAEAFGGQPLQHLISAKGAMRLKQDFKCPAAHRC